jgi:hypothetical protein
LIPSRAKVFFGSMLGAWGALSLVRTIEYLL